jgi:hypothetical protein
LLRCSEENDNCLASHLVSIPKVWKVTKKKEREKEVPEHNITYNSTAVDMCSGGSPFKSESPVFWSPKWT